MDYRKAERKKAEALLKDWGKKLPKYAADFLNERKKHLAPQTVLTNARDIYNWLSYICAADEGYKGFTASALPAHAASCRTPDEMSAYLASITVKDKKGKTVSPSASYLARVRCSLTLFMRYLETNGYGGASDYKTEKITSAPVTLDRYVLSSREIKKLLEGVEENDRFLIPVVTEGGEKAFVLSEISDEIRLRREKAVSRNLAILSLIADLELRSSEIAALDIKDIDYAQGVIIAGKERRPVMYTPRVRDVLARYLHGEEVPESLLARQTSPDRHEFLAFCTAYMDDPGILTKARRRYGRTDEEFISDILACTRILRRSGRKVFRPAYSEPALFLSNRGRRISQRMVEHMVREMVRTYLPEAAAEVSGTEFRMAVRRG